MKELFLFELKYRLRRPATYIYCFLMFLIPFLIAVFAQSVTAEFVNSPSNIAIVLMGTSIFGLFFYAAIMGVPIFRDQEHKTAQTYFTYPVKEKNYVLGRFFGSFTIVTIMNLMAVLGAIMGYALGILLDRPDYGTYAPFDAMSYLLPFLFIMTFNSFLIGSLFFSLMAFFKKMPIIYLGGILIFVFSILSQLLLTNLDYEWLSVYVDPFGEQAFDYVKKYWSTNELNSNQLPLSGKFLLNRLLWLGIGAAIFLTTIFRFSFKKFLFEKSKKVRGKDGDAFESREAIPSIVQTFPSKDRFGKMLSLSKIEILSIVKDPIFLVLLLIGLILALVSVYFGNQLEGTPSLALTRFMVDFIGNNIIIFSVVILVIYAGEAVHRTRKDKTFVFYDALPVTNSTLYFSKIIALLGIATILCFASIIAGIIYQTGNGYFNYEIGMYLKDGFLLVFPKYVMIALFAFFVHVLVNNKFLGHFIVILLFVGQPMLMQLAFKSRNPMVLFTRSTGGFLSDLNSFGHYMTGKIWMNTYWILFCAIFAAIGLIFWNRGFYSSFKERLRLAKQRLNGKTILAVSLLTICFLGVSGFNYYNLKVLNRMETGDFYEEIDANAEKKYAKFIDAPHIKITDMKAYVDIFPADRSIKAKAELRITNSYDTPIDTVFMYMEFPFKHSRITKVVYKGKELLPVVNDTVNYIQLYKLPEAIQPAETASMSIRTEAFTKGFTHRWETAVLDNGTFFRDDIFPRFHYDRSINDNGVREKYGLDSLNYLNPPRTDSVALKKSGFNEDSDYINFEAVLSTSADQVAIAPGKLTENWKENGRNYFQYKLGGKTDLFFNFVSGAYDIEKDIWTAPSGKKVAIEIYHSPKHKRNLIDFIRGLKVSLDYNSKNFLEYPYEVIRIVEFPAHSIFAQSFATTIPFSEDFGFVADFSKADDFNYVFSTTSHEVAHQWWGHIVNPSKTIGSNIVSETLAEYVSLMTMKQEYGENAIKTFLKSSLDTYLTQRSFSFKPERSLMNVETQQHIWYQKGSMIMYDLQDVIGEDKINAGLKSFLDEFKYFEKGVYATSEDLYKAIYEMAPDSLKYKVDDGFKEIVLYENRVMNAESKALENGKWETIFTVNSKKIYYDDSGKELKTDTKSNLIDIGLFGEDVEGDDNVKIKNPYYFELKWLVPGDNTFTIITDKKPEKAGVDPYNKLIDRNSDDNLKAVEEE